MTKAGQHRCAAFELAMTDRGSTAGAGSRPGRRKQGPRAFTLLEMALVLAVIVTALSLAWPSISQLLNYHSLQQGAQLVQARMAFARLHAIDAGVPYQFRYEPGGQRFLVIPYEFGAQGAKVAGKLPSSAARFDPAGLLSASSQPLAPEWLQGMPGAAEYAAVNWSSPVLFFPNGTATAGQVIIRDSKSGGVVLTVRALTGNVSVANLANGGSR